VIIQKRIQPTTSASTVKGYSLMESEITFTRVKQRGSPRSRAQVITKIICNKCDHEVWKSDVHLKLHILFTKRPELLRNLEDGRIIDYNSILFAYWSHYENLIDSLFDTHLRPERLTRVEWILREVRNITIPSKTSKLSQNEELRVRNTLALLKPA